MRDAIRKFRESENYWASLARDLIFVAIVLIVFTSASKIALGTYHPMVAVESGSMKPNMGIGDLIFIKNPDPGEIITNAEGMKQGHITFNKYGDVILYHKEGNTDTTPIIHRAMYHVKRGEPMWKNGPAAPHDGYITKGDNNQYYDQTGSISYHTPVKEEWIIGVALYRIPYIGYLPLIAHSVLPMPELVR
ncbi:signal peptidase I [Methanosarcinales archaeon]|nr:MAG: signal peptidase I [Methanosarcinales archaeon]